MKFNAKTALGVEISGGSINMAMLRQRADGVELVRAASGPVPDGVMEDGRIRDLAALAKAIKELRKRRGIRARKAAVSLSVSPVITSILEAPEGTPRNVGQFVRDELKSYVALSSAELAFDFCRIKSGQGSGSRLLAVAAAAEDLTELIRTYMRAGLDVETVEPEILAYVRAFHAERIAGRFDCNVILALLHEDSLTLCVFRREVLDLIRVEDIRAERSAPDELCRRLADQINTITRFFEVEVASSARKWEITVVADRVQLPNDAERFLKDKTSVSDLEVRSGEDAFEDTIVDRTGCRQEASVLAISLAMGLLNVRETGLRLNLVPPDSAEVRSARKQLILTSCIVVLIIPFLAFLAGKGLSLMTEKVRRGIEGGHRTTASQNTSALLQEQRFLEQQIELLSKRPDGFNAILGSRKTVDWAGILDDVRVRTPEAVRITALYNKGETGMSLEGLALSYEAARLFVKMLNESDYVSLASLTEAAREDAAGGLVAYKIDCTVTSRKSES